MNITYQLKSNQSCDLYITVDSANDPVNLNSEYLAGNLDISMKNIANSKNLLSVTAKTTKDDPNLKVTNFEIHGNTGTSAGLTPDKFEQESEIDYR